MVVGPTRVEINRFTCMVGFGTVSIGKEKKGKGYTEYLLIILSLFLSQSQHHPLINIITTNTKL